MSRRALRGGGVTGSNAALNGLARIINAERAGAAPSATTSRLGGDTAAAEVPPMLTGEPVPVSKLRQLLAQAECLLPAIWQARPCLQHSGYLLRAVLIRCRATTQHRQPWAVPPSLGVLACPSGGEH